jgi:predicted HD phosphohydrolase
MARATFTRMSEATRDDYLELASGAAAQRNAFADDVLATMAALAGTTPEAPVDRLEHCLQTATRARRDGADDETVVCALLHDMLVPLAPYSHDTAIAALLQPFISERNRWVLAHHGIFQGYYYFHHFGLDRDKRDEHRDSPYYDDCVRFCADWDEPASDPSYDSDPLESFAPALRSVLGREPHGYYGVVAARD